MMRKKVTFIMEKEEQVFLLYFLVLKREGYEIQRLEDPPTLKDPEQVNLLLQQIIAFHPQVVVYVYHLKHSLDDVIHLLRKLRKQLRTDFPPAHILVGNIRDLFLPKYYKKWVEVFLMSGLDIKRFLKEVEVLLTYPLLSQPEALSPMLERFQDEEFFATRHLLPSAFSGDSRNSETMLGDLRWGLGNVKAAEEAYTTAIRYPPDELKYDNLQHPLQSRGLLRQSLGQYGLALHDFLQSDKVVPHDELFLKSLAESYTALGFFYRAEQTYQPFDEQTLQKNPFLARQIRQVKTRFAHRTPQELSWSGVQPLPHELPPKMVQRLSRAIPSTFESREELEPLLRLVEEFPDNPHAWRYLGHAYWYGGHAAEAEAAFAEMVTQEPHSAISHFIQGCLAYVNQDYEKALALFQQAEQGELTQADRLQLYYYRILIQLRLGEAELAEQDQRRYDQLYGHPFFVEAGLKEPSPWQNEPTPRSPKILVLGAESNEVVFEAYLQRAGYQVKRLTFHSHMPPLLRSHALITNQILAWQPDLIFSCFGPDNSLNRFLDYLLYQIYYRREREFYSREMTFYKSTFTPSVSYGIGNAYDSHIPGRKLLQEIEYSLAVEASCPLLKRDWSPPTDIDPSADILDLHLSQFSPHSRYFYLAFPTPLNIRGNVDEAHTAILTDGRRVPIKLEPFTLPTEPFPIVWHRKATLDLPDPDHVAILSLIVPVPNIQPELISPLSARLQHEEAMATRHHLAHLAQVPQDGLNWRMLGDLYWGLGNFKAALQAYTTAEPDYHSRGLLRQSLGQYGLALGDFSRARDWTTYRSSLGWSIAENFKTLGFYHQAQSTYIEIGIYFDEGGIVRRQFDQVREYLEHPTPLGLGWGGVQPLEKEVPPPIVEILSTAIPSTFESLEAIRPLLGLVEQFPENPLVWQYLGHAYWYGGHEAEAEAAFAEMVKREPHSAVSHFIQGCLAYVKQDYEKALELFQQAEQGELPPADRLQLYQYRLAIQLRLGEAELAEQDKQRYDDLYGQPYFYCEWNKKPPSTFFVEQTTWQNEPVPRSPKILIVGEIEGIEKLYEKYLQTAGYQVKRLTLNIHMSPPLRSQAFMTNQILAWQPDLILYFEYWSDRFLMYLLYQVRHRRQTAFYPRQIVYSTNKNISIPPQLSEAIDFRFYHDNIMFREILQKIEQLLQVRSNSHLLKRDWSPPTDLDPSAEILDMPHSLFSEKEGCFYLYISHAQYSKLRGYVDKIHTAILTDGRRVPIKLDQFVMTKGQNYDVWWKVNLPDPEKAVILSLIVPAPK